MLVSVPLRKTQNKELSAALQKTILIFLQNRFEKYEGEPLLLEKHLLFAATHRRDEHVSTGESDSLFLESIFRGSEIRQQKHFQSSIKQISQRKQNETRLGVSA